MVVIIIIITIVIMFIIISIIIIIIIIVIMSLGFRLERSDGSLGWHWSSLNKLYY